MEQQDWEGKQLDKDLLGNGKLYSPDTCCFICLKTNVFLSEKTNKKSGLKRGVTLDPTRTNGRKYRSRCSNPFTGKNDFLGYYFTEEEAHTAYMRKKLELASMIAEIQPSLKLKNAVLDYYNLPRCSNSVEAKQAYKECSILVNSYDQLKAVKETDCYEEQ